MSNRSVLAGMEVPIIGSDSVKWIQLTVTSTTPSQPPFAPPTEDAASCSVIGTPPTYLIWRIHKSQPRQLEILEFCDTKEFPRVGLQIQFPDALSPFAVICENEMRYGSGYPYILYALTVSGVAYLIKLKPSLSYASSTVLPQTEIMELNVKLYAHYEAITAAAATAGCFMIGGNDGSVGCFQFGTLDPGAPGFVRELRNDAGFSRLWGLMSRGSTIAAVQSLVIAKVHGRELVFVLHSDGALSVWDLLSCGKIFNHTFSASTLTGAIHARLWVGEANSESSTIPLAVLCKSNLEISMEMVNVYRLHISAGDKINVSLEPSINISLDEGGLIDVRLTSNKLWILKEDGLEMQDLSVANVGGGESNCYALQESYVAEQLFQSSEHSSDDLLWLSHSVLSSLKDQVSSFVSSIFIRRLLLCGVYQNAVLRATLQDYNKHFTDTEFYSLTVDGLKKEILSLIENEGFPGTPVSVLRCWKTFCKRYFHNWCKNGAPCGLLVDSSTGAVGLIRKNSISLFRCLEDIELLVYSSFEEYGDLVNYGFEFSKSELEVLVGMLRCISNVSLQLGRASSAIFYESPFSKPNISSQEVVLQLLKILDTGFNSSIAALQRSELGTDTSWEKEVADHKRLRKFSADMFLSLHSLCSKATTWGKVLDVIERYLKFLVPRKVVQKSKNEIIFDVKSAVTVQSTSQVAKVMFESALDVLLLLNYMVNISGQIHMLHDDVSKIQQELVPMIQEVVTEWHIIYFLVTTPSEAPAFEDFSSQLSSLQIDSKVDKRSWNEKLGKCDFPLAFILLLNSHGSAEDRSHLCSTSLPDPSHIISLVRDFTSWIIWGSTEEESSAFFSHSTELALVLLKHGQFDAVQYLLSFVDEHSRKEKTSASVQSVDGHLSICLHLLGCCLLAQAQHKLYGLPKEQKVCEAVRCFFRAASTQGAPKALQSLPVGAGLPYLECSNCQSVAAWKLHYYQWAMQLFEQYNLSEAASQFALAALEQVDEALNAEDGSGVDQLQESSNVVRGRLWANVFKFTLDLNNYYDAYCAMISNPDEESKYICLRRFVIVLYERGAVQILCNGQLPFIGLTEKVEQELAWKALHSDTSAKPNPFKLLYACEMHRHNWRRAASYIYMYSARLRTEAAVKDYQHRSLMLQERLNGLSAAINALHLVNPAYAWIDPIPDQSSLHRESYPSKKARISGEEETAGDQRLQPYIDIEFLENEFVLASAEYLLSLANVKWTNTGNKKPSPDLVNLLVQSNLYDTAFTVLLKFWRGSELKRQLEKVFAQMSMKCCSNTDGTLLAGNNNHMRGLLLKSSKDEAVYGSVDIVPPPYQSMGNSHWETLEFYLEKYKGFHPRLPVAVAETLLSSDSEVELPLWLVRLFKGGRRECTLGMAGSESSPASLLQLYVDYGRYAEATNLLLEYFDSVASVRPVDLIHRKKAAGVWFPYTIIERLWYRLGEMNSSGHMIDHCEKLKKLIEESLRNHLNLLKVDSEDVLSLQQS
ncbi:nuclear pore complex protein NUP160 isoform X1 [Daucus carota subsp. sativus]|uniref:nuclear pore complex protein NUP160 isoform X1 n=1 Tax=Daucus carota subsp. sativus TaxID=79200 RepID=UPI0007EFDA83|nr:PREDICTED: nuclear pore complex protein NUP160 isoform X1 [Daucus carota subsp. sativus]